VDMHPLPQRFLMVCKFEGCGLPFHSKQHLTTHVRSHETDRHYICGLCSRTFKRKPDRNRHRKFSCGTMEFDCIVCKKEFCRADSLKRHLSRRESHNPCSMMLRAAGISRGAVVSRRARREDLGSNEHIENTLRVLEDLEGYEQAKIL
jgi:DNA-directed RNA polymerase subunit RPC12/RpoP